MGALPSPFTAAERSRYRYGLRSVSSRSLTPACSIRPPPRAAWFEQTIGDQLDLGRPDKMQIVFDRKITKRTPGRFQTKVIHRGVEPVLQAHYKHSKVKQYFKDGRALRTETTVNDPYDFAIKRTLSAENWQQLTRIGEQVNERLLGAELAACQCAPDPAALQAVVLPSLIDGQPAPAPAVRRPAGDGAARPVCAPGSTCSHGLTNRSLRELDRRPDRRLHRGQATYDLRRVRRKGLIRRRSATHAATS